MSIYDAQIPVPGLGDGQSGHYTLAGTGTSVPAGLEAIFEYNGLLLNVQANIDRYKITQIDGLADPDLRDTRDVNTDEDGETPFNAFYGGRTLVFTGEIQTYSAAKLRDMTQALKQAFGDISKEYPFYFRTGDFNKDHFIMCKKIGAIPIVEQQQDRRFARQFQISLRASYPFFLSHYVRSVVARPVVPANNVQLFVAHNAGNYKASPIFRIYGPATNSQITNAATGLSFSISAVMPNQYIEFDIRKKTLLDWRGLNRWDVLGDDSDYVKLVPGDNHIFYTGNSPRIDVQWYDTWI